MHPRAVNVVYDQGNQRVRVYRTPLSLPRGEKSIRFPLLWRGSRGGRESKGEGEVPEDTIDGLYLLRIPERSREASPSPVPDQAFSASIWEGPSPDPFSAGSDTSSTFSKWGSCGSPQIRSGYRPDLLYR